MRQFDLLDAVEQARQHPDTFWVPSAAEIAGVKPGDFVKVSFHAAEADVLRAASLYVDPADFRAERLWLEVVEPGIGRIANEPVLIDARMGELVRYEPRHVLNVLPRP
jgi:hypothetical protein